MLIWGKAVFSSQFLVFGSRFAVSGFARRPRVAEGLAEAQALAKAGFAAIGARLRLAIVSSGSPIGSLLFPLPGLTRH